ncbi:hypothetical protein [Pseudoflavonifractor sp. MSJ-37]|uniref:hypothetical protein n=1 Tax=Pseudoflavonifractor sp. MSJ-37 TaxID=2841531 RepID=UPI001C0F44CD|nr:hypothetical protein [Pseudoflavonifractor sp. MSJ-37]MBU5436299.1 hypothetical protein [Pseudoflavonifractor sp. MSJ-37]
MPNYTKHHQLHQWGPGDPFLRTDFNEDFAKIDGALGGLERRALMTAYDLYDLMLRMDLERLGGGAQRGLFYDGFLNDAAIAEMDEALTLQNGALRLFRQGEAGWTDRQSSSFNGPYYSALYTAVHTATGPGMLTGFTVIAKSSSAASVSLEVWVDGAKARQQSVRFPASSSAQEAAVTLEEPVRLSAGQKYYVGFPKGGSSALDLAVTASNKLAGTAKIVPLCGETADMTTISATPPAGCRRGVLYARYSGGAVSPALNGTPLVQTGQRATTETGGQPCTEGTWTAELDGGPVQLTWTLHSGEEHCTLYDHGLLFF